MGFQPGPRRRRFSRRRSLRALKRSAGALAAGLAMMVAAGLWYLVVRNSDNVQAPKAASGSSGPDPARVLVHLPQDDRPHRDAMEWWYYNGRLQTQDGREFTFHYVFFLVNTVVPYTAAHLSVADLQTGQRFVDQKQSPGNPSATAPDGFAFTLGLWKMAGADGDDRIQGGAGALSFDLRLSNPGPVVYQGGSGLLDFRQAGTSYYYSRPRMRAQGTLTVDGRALPVTGTCWFDHQWGNFQTLLLGWDWFSLQLDDGADLMLYRLRDTAGQRILFSGTCTRNGATRVLGAEDFHLQPLRAWISKATGTAYNTAWNLSIPSERIDVQLEPRIEDCEMDTRPTTLNTYWEGPLRVRGSHAGRGFEEISPGKGTGGTKIP